jgi:hypothetical protein
VDAAQNRTEYHYDADGRLEWSKEMQEAARHGSSVIPRGNKAREAGLPPGQRLRVGEFEEDRH